MFLKQITDASLAQNAYLIGCQRTGEAIVVDPQRDIDRYLKIAADNDLNITAVIDTHIHADYLSGVREFTRNRDVTAYLSAEGGRDSQFEWAKISHNIMFLRDGCRFKIGNIELRAMHSAGHTPEHMSFLVTDHGSGTSEPLALLSGDFIFVGDVGRPDLLESAPGRTSVMEHHARALYQSLRLTSGLPDHLQILPAHGDGSACGKSLGAVPTSVLGYERINNSALRNALEGNEVDFVNAILSGQPDPPPYFARMKYANMYGPTLLPDGKLPEPRRLELKEICMTMNAESHTFLDLRTDRVAFMNQHLKGSLFAPIANGALTDVAGCFVDKQASIILLLPDESHLEEAVRQLVRIGFDEVPGWIPVDEALNIPGISTTQKSITSAELADALLAQPDALVLDVRTAGEFAESHVAGAKNIAHTNLAANLAEIPTNLDLYVHCENGSRSSLAVPYLASQDREIIHVDGAFDEIPESLKKNKTTTRIYQRQTA